MDGLNYLIGGILLTLGRRLFWLFIACIGFAAGFNYGHRFLSTQSELIILGFAFVIGLAGALLAIFLQHIAIALYGFLAGGYITMSLLTLFGLEPGRLFWLPYFIGGVIGAVLLFLVFDWALIFLSSFMGAAIIVQTVELRPQMEILLFLLLILAGIIFQMRLMLRGDAMR